MLQSIMGYGYPPWCLPHGILGNVAKHYGILVPPCGQTEGQTRVKTLLSRHTTYAGGNNCAAALLQSKPFTSPSCLILTLPCCLS